MDLPTYTNIWRIEKRLYKLYDLRLPMPLPLGQIAAFAGITVPYVLFLTLIGMPFNHNLFWLYVLPPWAITWLATRPVLENKRLPELLISQVRYLGEPRVWCRMSPPDEKDEIMVTGRVWHARRRPAARPAVATAAQTVPARTLVPLRVQPRSAQPRWAPSAAPAASRGQAGPGHRTAAGPQPAAQPAPARPPAMAVQVPARNGGQGGDGTDARAPAVPWVRRGQAPALSARAVSHEIRPSDRAAAPARPPAAHARPARPPAAPAQPPAAHSRPAEQAPRPPAQAPRPPAPVARPPAAAAPPARPPAAPTRPARRLARPATQPTDGGQRPGWAIRARPGTLGGWPVVPPGPGALEVAHAESGRPVKRAAPKPGWQPKRPGWDPGHPAGDGLPGTPARKAPGSHAPGSVAPGSHAPGSVVPGSHAPGSVVPGSHAPGSVVPGSHAPGSLAPGSAVPEHVAERTPAPGAASHGASLAHPARPAQPVARTQAALAPSAPPAGQAPPGALGRSRPPQPASQGDKEQRDQSRARLPLPGPRRIVIIGCTSGAGQTVTALLTARMLASLRAEPVGALDLNPGEDSLAERLNTPAGTVRDLLGGTLPMPPASGVEVISGDGPGQHDFGRIGEQLAARYRISLIDPGTSGVGPALRIADQLVLVAPASGDAPRAVSMTRKWLESHGHHDVAANAVMVVNGVSSRSLRHVEEAEAIVAGRCRAIVRVPWQDQLGAGASQGTGDTPLRREARQAITKLAGVLVSGLAAPPEDQR